MKTRDFFCFSITALIFSNANAANWYWDADADATATTGGTGNWTMADALWRNGSATGTLTAYNDALGPHNDTAANLILAGGTDTKTLTLSTSTSYNLNKITVNNTYTLSTANATATFVGTTPTVEVANGKTLAWGIDLSAANATVTKTGTGTWQFNNSGGQVTSNNTTLDITAGTLQFNTSAASANLFTGTGGIVKVGSDDTLSIVQTYTGGYVAARSWTLGSKVILNGGTFNSGGSTGALFMRLTSGTAIQVDAASTIAQSNGSYGQNITIEGIVTGTGNLNLNRAAAATSSNRYVNIKGSMAGYSGDVTIGTSTSAGYVLFGHSSGWGTGNLSLTGSGSRVMIGDEVATTYNGSWTGGSTLGFTTGTLAPAGTISVGGGAELTLMNTTASYGILFSPTAGLTVNGGTLSVKGTAGTSAFVPAADSTWSFGGSALSTVSGGIKLNNTGAIFQVADAVAGTGVDTTITGVISGANGFTLSGAGTLALGAENSYSGGTVINSGIVQANANDALGTGKITIGQSDISATSHSLRLNGVTIGNDVDSKFMYTADYLGTITALGGSTSTVNGNVIILPSISGSPSRGGHLATTGAGSVLRLMGTLDVGGGQSVITQRDGTVEYGGGGSTTYNLQVTGTARLASDDGISTLANVTLGVSGAATLDLNGFDQTLEAITKGANTASVINNGLTPSQLTLGATTNRTFAGTIADGTSTTALVKQGTSVLTLSSANNFTGSTTIKAGTLALTGAGSIANSTIIIAGDTGSTGAVLDASALGSLTIGSGQKIMGIGDVTVGSAGSDALIIQGTHAPGNSTGIQTVNGNLVYSSGAIFEWNINGNTTIQSGAAPYEFDQVAVTGNLTVDDTTGTGTIFRIVLGAVDLDDPFWSTPAVVRTWTDIFTGYLSLTGGFHTSNLEVTGGDITGKGTFTINGSSLTWTAVPEPSSALAGLLLGVGLLRRRR